MKKALTITGFISLSLIIFGSLFKIQHWPGGGLFLVLGNTIFITIFLMLLLIYNIKNRKNGRGILKAVVQYFTLLFLSAGLLFKIQHWPGAGFMLLVGMSFLGLVFLPVQLFGFYKEKRYREGLNMLWLLMVVAGFLMVLGIRTSKSILDSHVINNRLAYQCNLALLEMEKNKSLQNNITYSAGTGDSLNEIREAAIAMNTFIEDYKKHLIRETSGLQGEVDQHYLLLEEIYFLDNYDIPTHILIGADPSKPKAGEFSAHDLREKLLTYKAMLIEEAVSGQTKTMIEALLPIHDDLNQSGEKILWETNYFYHYPLASVINTLSSLQNSTLTATALVSYDDKT